MCHKRVAGRRVVQRVSSETLAALCSSSLQIADFGLSKWRQLSVSKGSGSKPTEMEGTVIYMPPEEYDPSKTRRADVKHDMYR